MKIALLTDSFIVGGGLTYLYQVAKGIPEHQFVICGEGGLETGGLSSLPNVTIDTHGYGPQVVGRHTPDLIHFNHLRALATNVVWPRIPRCPTINAIHGIHLRRYEFLHGPFSALKAAARIRLERHCLKRVNLNIAETQADRAYLDTRLGIRDVEVIPNAIDPTAPRLKQANQHRDGGIHFLMIARFDFQKGHDVLLRGISAIKDSLRQRQCSFELVGDGPLRPTMERLAVTLGIADLIKFWGASDGIDQHLSRADCIVMPSRWEGMPFVLLEAGRHAKDVICSDAPTTTEVTGSGRFAVTFRNEDPSDLASALSDYIEGKGHGLGASLRAHVFARYSLDVMVNGLRAIYERFNK
jgi:glycosyltransferase involved in cell wall biosynthesis